MQYNGCLIYDFFLIFYHLEEDFKILQVHVQVSFLQVLIISLFHVQRNPGSGTPTVI